MRRQERGSMSCEWSIHFVHKSGSKNNILTHHRAAKICTTLRSGYTTKSFLGPSERILDPDKFLLHMFIEPSGPSPFFLTKSSQLYLRLEPSGLKNFCVQQNPLFEFLFVVLPSVKLQISKIRCSQNLAMPAFTQICIKK